MKTAISALMVLLLGLGLIMACTPAAQDSLKIGEQDAGKTVTLKMGDTLVVSLEGNVTTGFNWVPAPQEPALLQQVGEPEVTPVSDLVGASGTIVLKFKAAAAGQTLLRLDYKRPFEQDTPPVKTFEVTVIVK
jgi:inhibitor of cysteine peptidase